MTTIQIISMVVFGAVAIAFMFRIVKMLIETNNSGEVLGSFRPARFAAVWLAALAMTVPTAFTENGSSIAMAPLAMFL